MKRAAFVCSLFIVSVLLSGCIIVSSNKTQAVKGSPKAPCTESPQVRATLAEINAASELTSQSARANIYRAIAERPGLSPEERIHLTQAITTHLTSQSDREDILLALVNNYPPAPAPPQCKPKPELLVKPSTPCTSTPKKDMDSIESDEK